MEIHPSVKFKSPKSRIRHISSKGTQSMAWFQNFEKLHDLYMAEFNSKKEEGRRVSEGIMDYMGANSIHARNVLDIPCGIGRISHGLLMEGMDVTGVDVSPSFLNEFRNSTDRNAYGGELKLIKASFNTFRPHLGNSKYDLMINWWTSFGYSSYDDDVRFFSNLRSFSHRDTVLMVETWHKDYIMSHRMPFTYKDLGEMAVMNENSFPDNGSAVKTMHKYFEKSGRDLLFLNQFESAIRLYSRSELQDLMRKSGWKAVDIFNDIESRTPFSDERDRIVMVLKPETGNMQ